MSKVKTCERSTKFIHYVDKEKMEEYCKSAIASDLKGKSAIASDLKGKSASNLKGKSASANALASSVKGNRKQRVLDTLVQPQPTTTQSQRFFAEEWVNVCEKNQNGLSVACDLYDNMKSKSLGSYNTHCYPTKRIDEYTGKLDKELNDTELEIICGKRIVRSIDVPHDVTLMIDFGKELLKNGYHRVKYAYKDDFTISEKNLTSETLFLWKNWMEQYGPQNKYGHIKNSMRKKSNYYVNYVHWKHSDIINIKDKRNYSGAVEWLLKGGDFAYLWLQSEDVINKIEEKYKE